MKITKDNLKQKEATFDFLDGVVSYSTISASTQMQIESASIQRKDESDLEYAERLTKYMANVIIENTDIDNTPEELVDVLGFNELTEMVYKLRNEKKAENFTQSQSTGSPTTVSD
jgi:hypothetical protein